jgi:hypothetical protein
MVDYINTRLGSVMTYKGQKNTWAELPTTGNKIGDVWNVVTASDPNGLKAGDNVAWDGTKWDVLSGTIDTSKFLTAEMDPTGVKSIAVTGTTTKTIEVTLNNDSKVSANFTDLNTTYTAGTTADLTTGTGTTAFVWSPKILADWVKSLISGATVNTKTDTFTTAASHLTTGTTAVYTLTATPKTIIGVTMNGVKQPLASYANATTTLTITQSKLPVTIEAGDEIEVTYNY